jgi:hypothetical protein
LAKLVEGKIIIRIMVFIDPTPMAGVPAAPGMIVQFGNDIDGDAILATLSPDWQAAEANGVKYKKLKNPEAGKPDIAAFAPDARTLIAGLDATMVKMLAKEQGAQPLLKQLQHSNFDNDILLEFVAAPLLGNGSGTSAEKALAALGGPDFAKAAKDLKSFSIKLNFSGKTLLHAEVVTDAPETAAKYAAMAQMGITFAKPKFEELKKQPAPMLPPQAVSAISTLGDEVFAGLTVKNDGPQLVVDLAMPASLPDALKLAAQMAIQMAPKAPGSEPGPKAPEKAPKPAGNKEDPFGSNDGKSLRLWSHADGKQVLRS